MNNQENRIELKENLLLLESMTTDQSKQPSLYHPGIYWLKKTKNTIAQIKEYGILNFRGTDTAIGTSYTDSKLLDIRNSLNSTILLKLIKLFTELYPFNKIYTSQVTLTKSYLNESLFFQNEYIKTNKIAKELIGKYKLPYSLLGGCISKGSIDNKEYSIHYLNLLQQHDFMTNYIDFKQINSVFEIGGGFGINIHLLLENYPNIKKVLYLDIPPHLYIGTQYLKSFYGGSVVDYNQTKDLNEIVFSKNNDLEIICIAPWQIESFRSSIDIFMNAHSFVEMPKKVIGNYVNQLKKFKNFKETIIALTSYDEENLETTFNPQELTNYFDNRNFLSNNSPTLMNTSRINHYYLSLPNIVKD